MLKKAGNILLAAAGLVLFIGAGASDAEEVGIMGLILICLLSLLLLGASLICDKRYEQLEERKEKA